MNHRYTFREVWSILTWTFAPIAFIMLVIVATTLRAIAASDVHTAVKCQCDVGLVTYQ